MIHPVGYRNDQCAHGHEVQAEAARFVCSCGDPRCRLGGAFPSGWLQNFAPSCPICKDKPVGLAFKPN